MPGRPARGRLRLGRHRAARAPWPTSRPAATTARSCSASSSSAPCPATTRPSTWAPPPGSGTRARTPRSCGRTCSAGSPTSTTAGTGSTTRTCAPSPSSTCATPRRNPQAQTRGWTFRTGSSAADDADNPVVEGRLRRTDCAQVTDGGAGRACWSPTATCAERARRKPTRPHRRLGARHRRAPLQPKLDRSRGRAVRLPARAPGRHRRLPAGRDPRRRARSTASRPTTASPCREYMAIDHFGITGPGESWKAVENGELERDGAIPVNPSGGLIGVGHPVGATGVRMLHDAARQVTGQAGGCQVEGARTVRHAEHRRQPHHHGQLRRDPGGADHGRRRGLRQVLLHAAGRRRPPLPDRRLAAADDRVRRRRPDVSRASCPADLYGVYLRNTENPLHPAIVGLPPLRRRRDDPQSSASATGRCPTGTGSSAPTGCWPSRRRALAVGRAGGAARRVAPRATAGARAAG